MEGGGWLGVFFCLLLVLPSASAFTQAVDDGRVRPLWSASWVDGEGQGRTGIDGSSVVLMTTEEFDMTHPDLRPCGDLEHHGLVASGDLIVSSPKSDQGSHGNLVVGTICGSGAMSDGEIRGAAHGATVYSPPYTPVCSDAGCADLSSWFIDGPVRILSNSVSQDPIEWATDRGMPPRFDILVTEAAGNGGTTGSGSSTDAYIGSDDRILAVAAANGRAGLAGYSSRGARTNETTWPDITAPGCLWAVSPAPWVEGHAISIWNHASTTAEETLTGDPFSDCPEPPPPVEMARLYAEGYTRVQGTSLAAPFVAGVAALMLEVNPALNSSLMTYLLTRTADAFLPTNDTDQDGVVEPWEFREQHGYAGGWGYVNGTAAVTAAHYLLLHPNATTAEAVDCASTGTDGGTLVLNPSGERCWAPAPGPAEPSTSPGSEAPEANASASASNGTSPPASGGALNRTAASPEPAEPSPEAEVIPAGSLAVVLALGLAALLVAGSRRLR